jgi:hypothetical protein
MKEIFLQEQCEHYISTVLILLNYVFCPHNMCVSCKYKDLRQRCLTDVTNIFNFSIL